MSQALLRVDTVDSGNLAEITIFGRPRIQNRVKSILLSLASWHKDLRFQRGEVFENLHVEEATGDPSGLMASFQPPLTFSQFMHF